MVEPDDHGRYTDPWRADVELALRSLLPGRTFAAVAFIDSRWNGDLSAAECEAIERAGTVRLAEFASGRHCAHLALRRGGAAETSIVRGVRGQPTWPYGWTGSISHSAGLAAAVVGPRRDGFRSVGIDLERVGSLDESLWSSVMTPTEQSKCRRSVDPTMAGLLVFSGKEAAFKAQFPVTGADLDFLDVEVDRIPGGSEPTTIRVLDHVANIEGLDRDSVCDVHGRIVGDIVVTAAILG